MMVIMIMIMTITIVIGALIIIIANWVRHKRRCTMLMMMIMT